MRAALDVCAYDRAGLGASDARPAGTTATGKRYADELHALLAGANVGIHYGYVASVALVLGVVTIVMPGLGWRFGVVDDPTGR